MKTIAALAVSLFVLQVQRSMVTSSVGIQGQVDAVGEPFIVLDAEKAWLGADAFWPLAKSGDPLIRTYAIRAIGRLEDPANVPGLLALGQTQNGPIAAAADAIIQSLQGFDPARDPKLISDVAGWFLSLGDADAPGAPLLLSRPLASITYVDEAQFHVAERRLTRTINKYENDPFNLGKAIEAAVSLESLLRLNPRFTELSDATKERLPTLVTGGAKLNTAEVQRAGFRALLARGLLTADIETTALSDGPVDLATQALAGSGGGLDEDHRFEAILDRLKDPSGVIRYEALRAYVRREAKAHGCQPLVDLLNDRDTHMMLAAIDALGDACKEDEDITKRLQEEVRVPPAVGPWHRDTHTFVTVAKRSPERVEQFMTAFTTHPVFWVRMYSVHAVVAAKDVAQLEKLALDADDNVREAALAPLLVLKKEKTDPVLIADLGRNDVQLLRSAAILAKAAPSEGALTTALIGALLRLTSEGKESSRDGRLALIDALGSHATPRDVETLKPLLKDFDPLVAAATATLLSRLSGSELKANPAPVRRGWSQQFTNVAKQCVSVGLSSGQSFRMQMDPSGAPIAADRFLKLALVDHYYDGLSIHRVVPNFVIQAGSPGANEYSGHKEYMRDEVALPNVAGSVGLSIRGRNTADGQFYVNLVNNARLDRGYTIFAHVFGDDMDVLGTIEEGVVMQKITSTVCPAPKVR